MSQLTQYSEFAEKHKAAYAAFKSIYEDKNPPPAKPTAARDIVSLIIVIALVIVMAASIVVSSSRTISEFGGDVIGVMAFIMLEGGLVAYAFFRARRNASTSKLEDARKLATFGLVLAFIAALGANVDNVLRRHGIVTPEAVNVVINLLVAVSAPTLAFISSDVLALELMASELKRRQATAAYDQAKGEWQDGLNRAWASQQARWGVRVEVSALSEQTDRQADNGHLLSGVSVASASEQTNRQVTVRSGYGHTRTPDGQTKVIEYLSANPDAARLPSRKLAELIGVGHDTANKGRNVWQSLLSSEPTERNM